MHSTVHGLILDPRHFSSVAVKIVVDDFREQVVLADNLQHGRPSTHCV